MSRLKYSDPKYLTFNSYNTCTKPVKDRLPMMALPSPEKRKPIPAVDMTIAKIPAGVRLSRNVDGLQLTFDESGSGSAALQLIHDLGLGGKPLQDVQNGGVRRIEAEHTNIIDLVDVVYVVKWYREAEIDNTREQTLLERLSQAECSVVPQYKGALTWQAQDKEIPVARYTLAVVTEYLPDGVDGWTLMTGLDPVREWDRLLGLMQALGASLAQLHEGLLASGYGCDSGSASGFHHIHAQVRLEKVAARLKAAHLLVPDLPKEEVPPIWPLEGHDIQVQDVHGDVHLGQFLFPYSGDLDTSSDVRVIDF